MSNEISMVPPSEKYKGKYVGETSRGPSQTNDHIDKLTSFGSDWAVNIPEEIKFSLDVNGFPEEKHEVNPTEVPFPKVPLALRRKPGSKDYFDPTVISFGPYHHGKSELQEIEMIKNDAMFKFIKNSGRSFWEFFNGVRAMNDSTRACYVDCSQEKYCDNTLALIMLRDGCLISYVLDIVVNRNWPKVSELFVKYGSFLGYASVLRDMILLENQIPLKVLELLMSLGHKDGKKKDVRKMIKQVIFQEFWCRSREDILEDKDERSEGRKKEPKESLPEDKDERSEVHFPLQCIQKEFIKIKDDKDVHRKKEPKESHSSYLRYCCVRRYSVSNTSEKHNLLDHYPSYLSLSELKAKGIRFMPIRSSLHSISASDAKFIPGFFYAQLELPPLILNYDGIILLNNLIALELSAACQPNDAVITSYINFLKAIIASPADVKELRSKGILLSYIGNDDEMFKFFKEISTGSFSDFPIHTNIRGDIEKHCSSNCKTNVRTWVAEIIYTYFRNPWSAIGLIAAIAVIVLTFVQTYFTIYPVKN